MSKIILDLCGGTGAWSKPYRDAGYDVRLVTLPDGDVTTYEPPAGVYGILAAPPCTEFSKAKGAYPRDYQSAMKVVAACMRIIWQCRTQGSLKFWAMENPEGMLRQFMGKPAYEFEQWEFGSNTVKPTDIWGYFNPPRKTVRVRPDNIVTCIGKKSRTVQWYKVVVPDEYKHLHLSRAAARAITPAGFAQAFFKANR